VPLGVVRAVDVFATGTLGSMSALEVFSRETRDWFEKTFDGPTPAQELGWPKIASRTHTLIQAPTGSWKTLAAFLFRLDRLVREAGEGIRL
jgi:ATP-dependent Lhr-like helicase